MPRPSAKRTYSVYLDDAENAAIGRVAQHNHTTANAVIRALCRQGLGLPHLELELPDDVREWASQRASAAAADRRLAS